MPRATVTVEQRIEVKLKPELRAQLSPLVRAVQENKAEMKRLKKETAQKLADIEAAFKKSKAGKALLAGVLVDGVPVKMVCGTQRTLNRDKLVELGCDPEWFEEATDEKPKKAYISVGAEKDND